LSGWTVDAYFNSTIPTTTASGDLPPVALRAEGQRTVEHGLVTTKFGASRTRHAQRRIAKRQGTVALEQLALSPQCGFSSTVHGNNIASRLRRAK